MKKVWDDIFYHIFCVFFFVFFYFIMLAVSRFLFTHDSVAGNISALIGGAALYFAAGRKKRRESYNQLIKIKSDMNWFYFHLLFRIIIGFLVFAFLCIVFLILDRTLFRSIFPSQYWTQALGYKWLLIVTFFVERSYGSSRKRIIRKIYDRYKKIKTA